MQRSITGVVFVAFLLLIVLPGFLSQYELKFHPCTDVSSCIGVSDSCSDPP